MRQNSNQTKHLPTLLVQQIRLQWYKDCRGGNAAVQRNQYPRAMRLPKDFFSYYPFGLPTHFASIIQRPDGFQIDRDCRRLIGTSVRCRSDIPTIRPGRNSLSMSWHWIWLPASMGELSAMGGSGTGIQESGIMYWIF